MHRPPPNKIRRQPQRPHRPHGLGFFFVFDEKLSTENFEIFSLFWRHQVIDDDTWLESFVVQLQLSQWFFWRRPEDVGSAAQPSEQMVDDET